jgi:choline dehydrogenase
MQLPNGAAQRRGAVVDSGFRVHGVAGLRIVGASVFPKIPGFHRSGLHDQ